ncbi:hypothetical protein C6W20_10345 [Bacillus sp. NMCN6]|nr:hypothetical protein C6W21_10715 [Bacillus sp. NMCN1]PRR97979.1 hypothetical protein C6W20_10345 [Bacillus sp. NMCN6]
MIKDRSTLQYADQNEIKEKGIIMSMSHKGMPADNASIETFHSSLKSESHRKSFGNGLFH